jgi:endonuclease/exonuclease/phosphatase family metal-dependent hydrolase
MRICFCRHAAAIALLLLAGCASQETSVQTIPPPPDLQPQPIRATAAWAMAGPAPVIPVIPRAISNSADDIPRPRSYARSSAPPAAVPTPAPTPIAAKPAAVATADVTKSAAAAQMKSAPKSTVLPPTELKVMTFNLRVRTIFDGLNMWDYRRNLVAQTIQTFDPDLLGTQEGLSSMEDDLRGKLPGYTFFGVGRGDGKRGGEMCGVFFRTDRFEMIDGGHFWLSHSPDKPGSRAWGAIFPRMVTWVKLRQHSDGQTFCWFNTHLDAWNSHARGEETKLMLQYVNTIAGPMATVITGDFNADQGSPPYQTMLSPRIGEAPLVDTFRAANPERIAANEGTMHNFSGRHNGQRIDWILASEPHFQVISAAIDRVRGTLGYPSDHFPVTATLRLAPSTMPLARIE